MVWGQSYKVSNHPFRVITDDKRGTQVFYKIDASSKQEIDSRIKNNIDDQIGDQMEWILSTSITEEINIRDGCLMHQSMKERKEFIDKRLFVVLSLHLHFNRNFL